MRVQHSEVGQKREIFICQWHRNREGRRCLAILPVASIQTSTILLLRTHRQFPSVRLQRRPALRRMQLGGAREWLPPRWESLSPGLWDPLVTPLKRHSSAGSRTFFSFLLAWLGRRSKSEPLRSSHLRLATRRATLRSEADKHSFFFLSLLFQPRLSRPFISAALSSLFTRQKAVHID